MDSKAYICAYCICFLPNVIETFDPYLLPLNLANPILLLLTNMKSMQTLYADTDRFHT